MSLWCWISWQHTCDCGGLWQSLVTRDKGNLDISCPCLPSQIISCILWLSVKAVSAAVCLTFFQARILCSLSIVISARTPCTSTTHKCVLWLPTHFTKQTHFRQKRMVALQQQLDNRCRGRSVSMETQGWLYKPQCKVGWVGMVWTLKLGMETTGVNHSFWHRLLKGLAVCLQVYYKYRFIFKIPRTWQSISLTSFDARQ